MSSMLLKGNQGTSDYVAQANVYILFRHHFSPPKTFERGNNVLNVWFPVVILNEYRNYSSYV